ncbi:MAG TPA: hypothetical protein VM029_09545 [Opitutaceae bacterium]|nr:hypothetical protein [Opitutaceae bacterium]
MKTASAVNPIPAGKPDTAAPPKASTKAKGGLSESTSLRITGHGLEHWFRVLDRFGAVEKGHTAAARHLADDHQIEGWYAQGITVAFERARGVRAANQRCDGKYEVSVSKVFAADADDVIKVFTDRRLRKRWTASVDQSLVAALSAASDSSRSKGWVVRPDGQGRWRYKWGETTVQCYLYPKPGGKVSMVVTNMNLEGADAVEERRAMWKAALNAIATHLAA